MEWTRQSRFKNKASPFIFFFILLFCLVMRCPLAQDLQNGEKGRSVNSLDVSTSSNMVVRRLLIGPGSSPPRCTTKCGKCKPCRPVHVTVPPGYYPVAAEYYPKAWMCKCRNKYYTP